MRQEKDYIYPVIIKDNNNLVLIDTGYPGQLDDFISATKKEGLNFDNIKTIILTHHDIDHIGNLKAMSDKLTNIKIISSELEKSYISGNTVPVKLSMLEKNLENLTNYDIDTIICYHGGIYNNNVNEKIKELYNKISN